MSIASEISRLQTAKTNIKSAIEAKGVTVGSVLLSDYAAKVASISGGGTGSEIYELKMGTKTTITDSDIWIRTLLNRNYGCYSMFYGLTTITSVSITSPFVIGLAAMQNAFQNCTEITTVNLSGLTSITVSSAYNAFNGCNKITSVDMSNLESGVELATNRTRDMFTSPLLTTITVHPHVLSSNSTNNAPFYRTTNIQNVTLTQIATTNVYLNWQPSLTSISVLNVLNKLSTSVTGKTCVFAGITILATDPNRAAIGALVSSLTNWTISGLTLQ